MPTTLTTGSPNIASLDSKINSDLCIGIFYTDLSPSIFIGSGADNVLGASLKVTNPYGVVIKNYPTSGYDIYPPITDVIELAVPTQAGNYQYGTYTFDIQLTDADGTIYTVSKSVNICAPDANNKTRKYGSLSAQLNGNCVTGKLSVIADTVPTYKGVISQSQVNAFTLEYPTSSGIAMLSTSVGSFSATLFEGVYKFNGTICALYNLGDNVYVKVNYKVKREKNIRCLLDKSCVAARLASLQSLIDTDCTDAEKIATQNTIIQALLLLTVIDGLINDGQDASDFIAKLESDDVLGCQCTCNCADGTPIINANPTGDFSIAGCNVTSEVVDLTTVYTIENYAYTVEVAENGGAITITTPTLADCTKTQTITFNIAPVYAQIKNQINNSTEYDFWALIIRNALSGLNISCLTGDTGTLQQLVQSIINEACTGGDCDAEISTNATTSSAGDVNVTWVNVADVYEVAVYMDNVLVGTVLAPSTNYTIIGAADGTLHEYTLVSKCSNGSVGNGLSGTFTYFGCPLIAVPTVSMNNVPDATCPYDLTALVNALPIGITAEWHNLNNTLASSLTASPAAASDGTYFVFAKNSDGCYSLGVQVTLVCSETTNCSAPQTLLVESIVGGNRVRFQNATFPPPLNSYTVKRRLKADPDISGSYTTIGTPTWNATVNRWEILDGAPTDNILYTYRAISNCASTAPYTDYDFANITCPTVTLTPHDTDMDYSFTNSGGGIDKYEVKIYSEDGITLIHTDTQLPVFSSPITGTFLYLDEGTTYNVRLRVYIGTYFVDCPFTSAMTGYNYTLTAAFNLSIDSVTGTGVPALAATGVNGIKHGHQTGISGNLTIELSGTVVTTTKLVVSVNNVVFSCTAVPSSGVYVLACTALDTEDVIISVQSGVC